MYRGFEYQGGNRTEPTSAGFQAEKSTWYIPWYRGKMGNSEAWLISYLPPEFESHPLRHSLICHGSLSVEKPQKCAEKCPKLTFPVR
jgi:hypothetical protein